MGYSWGVVVQEFKDGALQIWANEGATDLDTILDAWPMERLDDSLLKLFKQAWDKIVCCKESNLTFAADRPEFTFIGFGFGFSYG